MNCRVGTAQWHSAGLRAGWSTVRVPAGAGNFSLHHRFQTGSGAHAASYPMGARGSYPGSKRPGHEADHSPPSSAEVEHAWSYTPFLQYVFVAWNLLLYEECVCSLFFLISRSQNLHIHQSYPADWCSGKAVALYSGDIQFDPLQTSCYHHFPN
jgi:hypothetical protein